MRVIIRPDYAAVSEWVALYVKKRINAFKPTPEVPYFVLGLPTGSSPIGTYQNLVKFHKAGELSFKNVVTFNMDEYVELPRDHPESYHSFMWNHLFKHIDILPQNVHILNGNAPDLEKECAEYEKKMQYYGGVELFLGGIGVDGHIAFNEPGSALTSRTRIKTLAYETIVSNARFFGGSLSKVPKMALTVGVGTVMDAREVLIIISGQSKAAALEKCIEQGVNHMYTLSAVQLHPRACIVCDDDATGELRVRTVRYFKGLEKVHNELLGLPEAKDGDHKEIKLTGAAAIAASVTNAASPPPAATTVAAAAASSPPAVSPPPSTGGSPATAPAAPGLSSSMQSFMMGRPL